ncbi:MAG: amidohydrolase [Lachnospiraceae bacterium]|nr:amidohydrolase [Lachnospiraceae bacterium]
MWKDQILKETGQLQEELVQWRRNLHRHPEVGFELEFTKGFVKEKLIEMGCEPADCGKCGLVVLLGKPGKRTILLRADMDALPITEEAEIDYVSQCEGYMHGCGHDMHTAMLLGAAKVLKAHEGELCGQVKLMFQPAEEIFAGSHDMIEAGVLENPHVDAAMTLHVTTGVPLPVGFLRVPEGGTGTSSSDEFHIIVNGKGGHGAMPHLSVDPINVMSHICIALQEIHAREVPAGEFLVITPGIFQAGKASNIIADQAEMYGTIRTGDQKMVEFAKRRITEISESVAKTFRATAEVSFAKSCPPMIADHDMAAAARKYMTELLEHAVIPPVNDTPKVAGGSEDFAYVSCEVPTIGMFLGAGNSREGAIYPQHHPKAEFDDSVLSRGAAVYAYMAVRWLEENGLSVSCRSLN